MNRLLSHWGLVVLWMALMFYLSSSVGGAENTSLIIEPLLRLVLADASQNMINIVHLCVRKVGHCTEYAVLALLVLRAVRLSARWDGFEGCCRAARIALIIAIVYAMTDEFHQCFVPGRTPSLVDVAIDASGAFSALAVFIVMRKERTLFR